MQRDPLGIMNALEAIQRSGDYNDAVRWYNRESRRANICGIDLELAKEAADRFGVSRADVLSALGWKE